MKQPLPPVLRAAFNRRAMACAWLTLCEHQCRYPHLTLDTLETGPGGSGKSILAEIATLLPGKVTPRRPPSKCWSRRANVRR